MPGKQQNIPYYAERVFTILNTNDYFERCDCIINDHSKFPEVVQTKKDHPVITKENFIKNYIKTYFIDFGQKL